MDSGASKSFITRAAAEAAGLTITAGQTKTKVRGIAGSTMTNEKAAATLHGQGTRYTHEFLVLDKIGMLAATTITAQDLQLQATALADLWPSPKRNIDIIIGQDLLWINDKTPQPDIPGQDRLKVESTPFGKVISGHYQQQTQAETTNLLSTEQDMKQEMNQETKQVISDERRKKSSHQAQDNGHVSSSQATEEAHPSSALRSSPRGGGKTSQAKDEKIYAQLEASEEDAATLQLLKHFCTNEGLGIEVSGPKETKRTAQDSLALNAFKDTLSFENGEYSVGLSFRDDGPQCSDNYRTALSSFLRLEERQKKAPEIQKSYRESIEESIKNGDVELCTDKKPSTNVFYMPHSSVLKEESTTTKLRVVFNASSKPKGGVSLNETLLPGPAGETDILKNLIKFRWNKVGFAGDVKRMFHAIQVIPEHRDFLRFLWRSNSNEEIKVYRFKKIPFGLTCASFLAQETVLHHVQQYLTRYPQAVQILQEDRWVDDLLSSLKDEKAASKVITEIIEIMRQGNFIVRKWISNSQWLVDQIPLELRLKQESVTIGNDEDEETKTLGIKWDTKRDLLQVPVPELKGGVATKRTLTRAVASIYDPPQFLAPFVVRGKRMLQQSYLEDAEELKTKEPMTHRQMVQARKQQWDKMLSPRLQKEFKEWQEELPQLQELSFNRCLVSPNHTISTQAVHIFSDASPFAFSTAAYLRTEYKDGPTTVNFIAAKCRVAPSELQSRLPRLELLGAVLSARLVKKIKQAIPELTEDQLYFWTDSSIALSWIRGEPGKQKVWVANRTREIQESTPKHQWMHIDTKDNPSDQCTRGLSAKETLQSSLWKHGPSWLAIEKSKWPEQKFQLTVQDEEQAAKEMKPITVLKQEEATTALLLATQTETESHPHHKFMDEFSSLDRMINAAAMFKFKRRGEGLPKLDEEMKLKTLTGFVQTVQQQTYPETYQRLKHGQEPPHKWRHKDLLVRIDEDGIIRAVGRFPHEDLKTVPPMLLPHNHKLTKLIILQIHEKCSHSGPEMTLLHFAKFFWCSKARRTIKGVLSRCVLCQRLKKAKMQQRMAPLPAFRLHESPKPFTHTAVDMAGPLMAFDEEGTAKKCWIVLFTCLNVRAVNLQLVFDMTTETFIQSLRKFIARFGTPSVIYSDNAKTFKKAAKEVDALQALINSSRLHNEFRGRGIRWKFQTELAPHHGGCHERLVRSAKESLRAALKNEKLSKEQLEVAVLEAEAIVNSRPMANVSEEPSDELPVTPSMLIQGYDNRIDPYPADLQKLTAAGAKQRWKQRLHLRQRLQQRFLKDYIQGLRQRQKWHKAHKDLEVNDLVLVEDQGKRTMWPMARVTEVTRGRDNHVRSVTLKTRNGFIRRPVQRLVHLELDEF